MFLIKFTLIKVVKPLKHNGLLSVKRLENGNIIKQGEHNRSNKVVEKHVAGRVFHMLEEREKLLA